MHSARTIVSPRKDDDMEPNAKGNFRMNFNSRKTPGDNQPALERGIISTPDAPDEMFDVKMWAYKDAKGRVFYSGPSSEICRDAEGLDRVEALIEAEARTIDVAVAEQRAERGGQIELAPHRMMLFRNGYKLAETDAGYDALSDADKALNSKQPDLYGFWNPGVDRHGVIRPQLRVSVWEQAGRYGPFLAGNTQIAGVKKQVELVAADVAAAPKRLRIKAERGGR
jgi:hypothetical protein